MATMTLLLRAMLRRIHSMMLMLMVLEAGNDVLMMDSRTMKKTTGTKTVVMMVVRAMTQKKTIRC